MCKSSTLSMITFTHSQLKFWPLAACQKRLCCWTQIFKFDLKFKKLKVKPSAKSLPLGEVYTADITTEKRF